ncbi:hypothetical protein RIdsm_04480 [Roseovarius indicus]|uniref:Uncharacterized protein n=1 Tax=Roseovarius indicus TaxID=540747 RepID=A0A5P3AJW7_9RHOB|nr:hypothetical protein [Roseovarius indicus]QEW28648.1 hypothetical protein RIdsm_04480 [Roseovarius indicus]SFE65262.1 hypothetical protein SAMN04488031_1156 [Roseovarius indicus]
MAVADLGDGGCTIVLDIMCASPSAPIAKLVERLGIAPSNMPRIQRLTLLAAVIVFAFLHGKQRPEVTLA